MPFIVTDLSGYYSDFEVQLQTTPGTELGVGERFNLPRPYTDGIQLVLANGTAGKEIEISEVRHVDRSVIYLGCACLKSCSANIHLCLSDVGSTPTTCPQCP